MRPPEDSGGRTIEYDSFDSPDVKVEINDLVSYYFETLDIQLDATMSSSMTLTSIPQMVREGLTNPPAGNVGVFAEGALAADILLNRHSDFAHFMRDVLEGIRNTGAAATVIGEIYENGDTENAADIQDVAFAFSDSGATGPSWFRDVKSFSEDEQQPQGGAFPMAATGDDSLASQVFYPARNVTVYRFPDNSTKTVVQTETASQSSYQSGTTTVETSVTAPGGVLISRTTEETYTAYGGYKVTKTTTSSGDDRNGRSSTTETVEHPDGTMQVTSETSTTSNGETSTSRSDTVTVSPDSHREDGSEAGPIEATEERLETSGSDEYVAEHGQGY